VSCVAVCKPPHEAMAADKKRGYVHRLSRICFGTDFSANSERALDYTISAAEEYDAELTLLHVLEDVPTAGESMKAVATATLQLDRLIPPDRGKAVKTKTAVRIGKPYQQIVQFAEETQADMVVMGVHGRGALDLAVFGSTTYRVLQLGPCSVMAVHI
jgi:nucleotide-binding universal stress UspA family protein